MGLRGPPPKPTRIRMLEGNRGRRPLPAERATVSAGSSGTAERHERGCTEDLGHASWRDGAIWRPCAPWMHWLSCSSARIRRCWTRYARAWTR